MALALSFLVGSGREIFEGQALRDKNAAIRIGCGMDEQLAERRQDSSLKSRALDETAPAVPADRKLRPMLLLVGRGATRNLTRVPNRAPPSPDSAPAKRVRGPTDT